ncbi:hypothetical protein Ancab_025668 [Ancistrocladus abbreviatus]
MDLCWSSALMEVEKSADEKDPNKTNLIGQAIVREGGSLLENGNGECPSFQKAFPIHDSASAETARAEADDESLGMRDGGQEDSLGQVMSGSLAHQVDKVGSIKEHGPNNSEYEVGPHTDGSGGDEELQALESPGNQPKEAMERNKDGMTRGLRPLRQKRSINKIIRDSGHISTRNSSNSSIKVAKAHTSEEAEGEKIEISVTMMIDSQIDNMNRRNVATTDENKAEKIWNFLIQLGVINETEEVCMVYKSLIR